MDTNCNLMIVDEVDAKCNLVNTAADVKYRNVWLLWILWIVEIRFSFCPKDTQY